MATEAEVAKALREARDTAVTEAQKWAQAAVDEVTDPEAGLSYGGWLLQVRAAAAAKLWQQVYLKPSEIGPAPKTDEEQIRAALQRAADVKFEADQREEQRHPSCGDVGDAWAHVIRQVEIKPYRDFVEGVERATAPIRAEA
ncbi:hypothetical protein [Streptomyces boluensis]|uniref:Uncharacterized protein n=1 Tax=Streptomyces boluensis TaxID=1775135 RepID=A0A964XLX8_9ACTN|nr:hypothetical protein [Streptomyces boluensis]NBE51998.1 hypothetical protein [Streptomyces boluensis]